MKLTTKSDYCIRVLIYLQKHKGRVKIQDIANSYDISKNHLSVAVNKLSELGHILSTTGPKGGIEFNTASKNKSIGSLISQIENLEMAVCFDPENNSCTLDPNCKLKGMLKKATTAFIKELDQYKIKDLS